CHECARSKDTIQIQAIKGKVPFWNKDGIYNIKELEEWFYNEAFKIAESFDKRNGTSFYTEEFERAVYSASYKEGQRFWLVEIK
ncbi:MAG: hypothetical protein K2K35_07025, partial [Lachnospiraceae bacterium]|nr:hypothetical protein [Lachnospiraceae bacterium]